jgi:hypothetical protein
MEDGGGRKTKNETPSAIRFFVSVRREIIISVKSGLAL